MTHAYERLVLLYPLDIRMLYGREMAGDFARGLDRARRRGRIAVVRFVVREMMWLLADAGAERVATLQSHPSFHGRCLPKAGVVPSARRRETRV